MPTLSTCPGCARPTATGDRYCESCGHALVPAAPSSARTDRSATDLVVVAAVSDRGLVHTTNEDAYAIDGVRGALAAVVCDGVSSSTAGGVAAQIAAEVAVDVLRSRTFDDPSRVLVDAIAAAGSAVNDMTWSPARDGAPSTTIVVAVEWDGVVSVAGLGDSRAYWFDDQDARLLTRDDSWAAEQVARGLLTTDQAMLDPRAHMITAWLGLDAPTVIPEVVTFRPTRPGRLLLCTDGLWNAWPDAGDLAALARSAHTERPLELAHALADRAVVAGGRDNITVVVAECTPTPTGRVP